MKLLFIVVLATSPLIVVSRRAGQLPFYSNYGYGPGAWGVGPVDRTTGDNDEQQPQSNKSNRKGSTKAIKEVKRAVPSTDDTTNKKGGDKESVLPNKKSKRMDEVEDMMNGFE